MDLVFDSGTITSGGEHVYWELTTAGPDDQRPVVVLSHGLGGSHAVWYLQVPVLGEHFRVITWDSRGFGNSSNHLDDPSAENGGSDICSVLDHLGVDSAHLIGQSMGGWHTSAFAVANPDRVTSLTYADTIGGMYTKALREAVDRVERPDFSSRQSQPLFEHPALWRGTGERDPAHAFLYRALSSFHVPPAKAISVIGWEIDHATIEELAVPVLFVVGTHDGLFPAAAIQESASLIDGASFVEISDAGHSPYFEQPTAWNDAVLRFLLSTEDQTG